MNISFTIITLKLIISQIQTNPQSFRHLKYIFRFNHFLIKEHCLNLQNHLNLKILILKFYSHLLYF
jgi:hypothetical protein